MSKLYYYYIETGEHLDDTQHATFETTHYYTDDEFKQKVFDSIQWIKSDLNPNKPEYIEMKHLCNALEDDHIYKIEVSGVADMYNLDDVNSIEDIFGDLDYYKSIGEI